MKSTNLNDWKETQEAKSRCRPYLGEVPKWVSKHCGNVEESRRKWGIRKGFLEEEVLEMDLEWKDS